MAKRIDENPIPRLTQNCVREDCSITCEGSITTLIGWTPTYDKYGNPEGGDPNTVTTNFKCHTCGVTWQVATCMGEEQITQLGAVPSVK